MVALFIILAFFIITILPILFIHKKYKNMRCPYCKKQAIRLYKNGNTTTEILLWVLGVVPGYIYSLWRMQKKEYVCESCHQISTKMQLLNENQVFE